MIPLHIPESLLNQIKRESNQAYPNECCGIMFGRDVREADQSHRNIERLQATKNMSELEEQRHRFAISPKELLDAEESAAHEGRAVLGFYHSHPDHPAMPSEHDRARAWPFYSYVIASVVRGDVAITSWIVNDVTNTFEQQTIEITREIEIARRGKHAKT